MDKIVSAIEVKTRFQKEFNITMEDSKGKQYVIYRMSPEHYKYELLKRKLLESGISNELFNEITDVVDDLVAEAYNRGVVESNPDY